MQTAQSTKNGFLLINLGTPKSPSVKDVRQYLGEFLMDRHVLDVPWFLRKIIVSGFILPFRPKSSAEAYGKIWTDEGSPLLVKSQTLADSLEATLGEPVALSMRYGSPSIHDGIHALQARGVDNVCIIPLYPQHADSTEGMSSFVMPPFYKEPQHVKAWGEVIREHLPEKWDHLLFSYHGLPERHLETADPTKKHCLNCDDCCNVPSPAHDTCYRHQVYETSKEIIKYLGLRDDQYGVSFQSRLGRLPWLTPYTDKVLEELPSKGIKNVALVCPAFVVDNLETLEEMGMQGHETFMEAGGETFTLIPCINDSPVWVEGLADLCRQESEAQA